MIGFLRAALKGWECQSMGKIYRDDSKIRENDILWPEHRGKFNRTQRAFLGLSEVFHVLLWFCGGFAWVRGIPLFCLVFHCAGFGRVSAELDATHIETQSCARARANSTLQNIGKAIVQNGTAFMQNGTTRCNARALFCIVLNQYNQEQLTLLCFALCFTVSFCINAGLSSTIQCNGM